MPIGSGEAVKVTQVAVNKPSRLSFLIPALTSGDRIVQVRTRVKNNNTLRSGQLDAVLTVA